MNTGRLVLGVIFLALAALLTVLIFTLPEDEVIFMSGDVNAPGIPAVGLAVLGIIFLATARNREEKTPENLQTDPDAVVLNKRLEMIAWGLFLIMLGGFSFVPQDVVPKGLWSIGVGLIMLGLNVARYYSKIKLSGFTTFLGILSIVSGAAQLAGWESLEGSFLIIILGVYLIVKPWFDKQQLFGKVEEGKP